MTYGTVNADLITTSDGVSSSGLYGLKNRIFNGDMRIDQRNAGASKTITDTAALTYTIDRFGAYGSVASKFSVQQNAASVTPPVGFINYLGVTSLSAYTVGASENFVIQHRIEGTNISDLAWGTASAATVTLSFWVRSSLTGTFGGSLKNSADTRSYPFSYVINSANTWEQKTITISGDTSGTWLTTTGIGITLSFGLGVGSTLSGTAGSWSGTAYQSATGATSVVGTNGATFYITGVQLEKGSTATSFDYRPYGTELSLCQRYYEKSYPQGTAVPTNSTNGGYASVLTTVAIANQFNYANVKFAVTKRTSATINTYSFTSSTASVASTAAGTDIAAGSATGNISSDSSFTVYNNSGGNITPANGGFVFHWAASAEL